MVTLLCFSLTHALVSEASCQNLKSTVHTWMYMGIYMYWVGIHTHGPGKARSVNPFARSPHICVKTSSRGNGIGPNTCIHKAMVYTRIGPQMKVLSKVISSSERCSSHTTSRRTAGSLRHTACLLYMRNRPHKCCHGNRIIVIWSTNIKEEGPLSLSATKATACDIELWKKNGSE